MNRIVSIAVRYERIALRLAVAAFGAMFVVVGIGAALHAPARFVGVPLFYLMAAANFGWGVVLIGSWFAPGQTSTRRTGSMMRAIALASRIAAVVFLLGWFSMGAVLLVFATLAIF